MKSLSVMLLSTTLLAVGCAGPSAFEKDSVEQSNALLNQFSKKKKTVPAKASSFSKLTKKQRAVYREQMAKAHGHGSSGRYKQARGIYQQLIAGFPAESEPYHRLGLVADKERRHSEAQALFAEALRRSPKNAEIFNDIGYNFYLQGQLAKAESALLKSVTLRPAEPRYRNNLGLVLGHQGRDKDALAHFRRAGSEADAQYNLAFVKASKDDVEGAKLCFRRALVADPSYDAAADALTAFNRSDIDQQFAVDHYTDDGRPFVPFVEAGSADASNVRQVGYSARK